MKYVIIFIISVIIFPNPSIGQEIVVRSFDLLGASLEQEITFHPNEAEYLKARDDRLQRLRDGEDGAMVNPIDGPWMIVETTAKVGISYKGVGSAEGRKHLRRITAAEDAIYRFEKETKN